MRKYFVNFHEVTKNTYMQFLRNQQKEVRAKEHFKRLKDEEKHQTISCSFSSEKFRYNNHIFEIKRLKENE